MNKLELIQALKDATDITKSEASVIVDIFLMEWPRSLQREGGLKSGDCALFMSGNIGHTQGEIQKPGNGSKSLRRSCRSLSRGRN